MEYVIAGMIWAVIVVVVTCAFAITRDSRMRQRMSRLAHKVVQLEAQYEPDDRRVIAARSRLRKLYQRLETRQYQ